nr:cilia- and flagella-associated protein 57-like [Lepeophtheirus salmonis]
MTCHDWLTPNHVIIGTKAGKVIVLENGDLKVILEFTTLLKSYLESLEGDKDKLESFVIDENKTINSLITYSKGFIVSFGETGLVALVEKIGELQQEGGANEEEEMEFTIVQIISFDKNKNKLTENGNNILNMALNNSESILVVLSQDLQIYYFTLKDSMNKESQIVCKNYFKIFSYPFHNGMITGLDVCQRKPLVVTCGADHTIRIWNYLTLELELSKDFKENLFSVALHPSGMYLCAGFSDKLRLMNILIDDIRTFREFNVKASSVSSFSCGGHLLAAASSVPQISLFSTVDFQNRVNLRGHEGHVTSLAWSSDDRKLVSCADDGSLYEWNIDEGYRVEENVLKECSYNDLTLSPCGEYVYAIGSDKTVKMMHKSELLKEVDLHTFTLSSIILSRDGKMLFAGSVTGKILSIKFPLTLPGNWNEYEVHGDTVSQIKLSLEDRVLISAGRDGSLCFWSVGVAPNGEPPELIDPDFEYTNEILITKTELEEKNALIHSLRQRVEETRTESEYQMRLKDNWYNKKMKEERNNFYKEIDDLRSMIGKYENEAALEKSKFKNSLAEEKQNNEKALIQQGENYKAKLIVEYQKFDALEETHKTLQSNFNKRMKSNKEKMNKALEEMKSSCDKQLKENEDDMLKREEEGSSKVSDIEEMLKQTEQDADKEILELRMKYEKTLKVEKESNIRLRGEIGVIKKKYQSIMKDTEEQKVSIQNMNTENQKLNTSIKTLEKDITDLKKEINSRDDSIGEKEKEIINLKRSVMELRKNRLVLEYKIEDLRDQIHPKEETIDVLRSQIDAMETELLSVTQSHSELEIQLLDSKGKLNSTIHELTQEHNRLGKSQATYDRLIKELSGVMPFLQEPKALKDAVTSMGKKYCQDYDKLGFIEEMNEPDTDESLEAMNELVRQKVFLERTVTSLKTRLEVDRHNYKQESRKKVKEATFLAEEVDKLKKELKAIKMYKARMGSTKEYTG